MLTVPGGCEMTIAHAVNQVRTRERKLMAWVRSEHFNLEGFRDHVAE